MQDLAFLLALHTIPGLGSVRLKKLRKYFPSFQSAWKAFPGELIQAGVSSSLASQIQQARLEIDPEKYLQYVHSKKIQVVTLFDENYPLLLKEIYDPPIILYYKGNLDCSNERILGIVGTRKMTGYGRAVTEKFSTELSELGFTIVSGLARGIDTIAHQACLKAGGKTYAVLGGGLNHIFPPENSSLAHQIADEGGAVMSEFPPDYQPMKGNFPARNRIIAGLSQGILVTEAAEKSGSLITARLALEEGREVFAVPGPITSTLSDGTASLIKSGAKVITKVEDILEEFQLEVKPVQSSQSYLLSTFEEKLIQFIENEAKHIDEISRVLEHSSAEVGGTLIKLEISGVVKNLGGGNYIKNR